MEVDTKDPTLPEGYVRVDHIFPPSGPIGITFEENPLRIQGLIPGGIAASASSLQPGDVLLSVNGLSVWGRPFDESVAALGAAAGNPGGRRLVFARPPPPPSPPLPSPPPSPPRRASRGGPPAPSGTGATLPKLSKSVSFDLDVDASHTAEHIESRRQSRAGGGDGGSGPASPPLSPAPSSSGGASRRSGRSSTGGRGGGGGGGGRRRKPRPGGGAGAGAPKLASLSSSLSSIRRQLLAHRTASSMILEQHDDPALKADVIAPLERTLLECIQSNRKIRPLRVKVINDSYWYRNRALMGPINQMDYRIEKNEVKKNWDARIRQIYLDDDQNLTTRFEFVGSFKSEVAAYKACEKEMKARDQNPGLMEGVKFVGSFKREVVAYKACEKEMKARDQNPGLMEGVKRVTQNDLLATHFRVNVVSDEFRGKTLMERLSMVFEALAGEFTAWHAPPPGRSAVRDPVVTMKGFAVAGGAVLRLPFLRNLGRLGAELTVCCLTPSQWKPQVFAPSEAELYTKARTGAGALAGDPRVADHTSARALRRMLGEGRGVDPAAERAKGVRGHFFHGLAPEMKRLMLEEYQKSKVIKFRDPSKDDPTALIEKTDVTTLGAIADTHLGDGLDLKSLDLKSISTKKTGAVTESTQTKKKPEMTGTKKAQSVLGQSLIEEVFVDKDKEMVGAYQMHTHRVAHMAMRIQRIFRQTLFARAVRWTLRRQRAAVRLQAFVRGVYAKRYTQLYRRVARVAAIRIQCVYRGVLARRRVAEWRAILIPAVKKVQRAYRARLLLLFIAYLREYYRRARSIQRLVRGFLARQRYKKLRAPTFFPVHTKPAVRLIQRVWRGHCGRRIHGRRRAEMLHRVVEVPAAHLMQRIFRGGLGRKIARRKRFEYKMAVEIQKMIRGYLKRMWWRKLKYWWFQNRMATQMEKTGRGYIDRQMVALRIEKDWFYEVLQPCATKLQAVYRGHAARRALAGRRRRWLAALQLQMAYRTAMAVRRVRALWEKEQLRLRNRAATKAQAAWRAWKARLVFREARASAVWRRLYAGRMIMRCWLRYRTNQRLKALAEEWECVKSGGILNRLHEERRHILQDQQDAVDDLGETRKMYQMAKERIKELRAFVVEAELRLPKVEEELDNLEVDDVERGWGEAFDDEWNRLTNQIALANEEIRLQKVYMQNCQDQINELQLEAEELGLELDAVGGRAAEELEYLRRVQLNRGGRRQKAHWAKKIRYETVHWKIQEIRSKVIRRSRKDLDKYEHEALMERNKMLDIASTVSYDKYNERIINEKEIVKKRDEEVRKEKYDELAKKVYDQKAVRETYDAVVSSTLEILKGFSFDERRRKMPVGEFHPV